MPIVKLACDTGFEFVVENHEVKSANKKDFKKNLKKIIKELNKNNKCEYTLLEVL